MSVIDTDTLNEKELEDIILRDHKPFLDQMAKDNAIEEGTYTYTFKEMLDLELNTDNLLGPILPTVGMGLIQGLPDGGKSTFARELCTRIALDSESMFGWLFDIRHHRALIVLTEESLGRAREGMSKQFFSIVAERVEQRKKQQRGGVTPPAWNFQDAMDNLQVLPAYSLSNEQTIQCIEEKLKEKHYDVIVIDALADVLDKVDGNNNHQIRAALKPFQALTEDYQCLLLFVAHVNKAGYDKTPNQRDLSGGAALAQKVRLILDFRPDPNREGVKYLTIVKGNNIDDSLKRDAMVLHWSKETFLLSYDGEKVPKESIGIVNHGGREKTFIDWTKFIQPGEEITFRDLQKRMEGKTTLKERRLRERVNAELVKVGEKFRLPAEQPTMFEEPDVEAISPYMYD